MTHTTYHILTDQHDQFFENLDDVKNISAVWKKQGDSEIKLYKITTEEVEPDVILLEEEKISID